MTPFRSILAVLVLALSGCATPQVNTPKRDLAGKCWNWNSIEKTSGNAPIWCGVINPKTEHTCTRAIFHTGKHHTHTRSECLDVWKSAKMGEIRRARQYDPVEDGGKVESSDVIKFFEEESK